MTARLTARAKGLGPRLAGALAPATLVLGIVCWSKGGILAQVPGRCRISSGAMSALPTIDVAERRRRIGARHHLAAEARAATPLTAADDLVGIHATDPASVYLALRARVAGLSRDALGAALYEERSLVKILGMRRTMFV